MDPPPLAPSRPASAFPAGPVTAIGPPGEWPDPAVAAPPPPGRSRPTLLWYGLAAAALLAGGLVVVLVLAVAGPAGSGRRPRFPGPPDERPPLARLCPPPSVANEPPSAPPPVPSGPRTVDATAGISYRSYGQPWQS
jgi:hypothetical protein